MHPEWLSNAFLVWDEESREAFFVDSGAPLGPLHEVADAVVRAFEQVFAPASRSAKSA